MSFETILLEKKENYAVIYLNRPEKLNALNAKVFQELDEAINQIELDDSIHALILTGKGEKAFAAGADIKELHASGERSGKHFSEKGSKVMRRLEKMNIPVIAAVNGFALGGGCELAMSCHIRYASDNAKFGQPEVNLGIIPGYGGTQRLTKIVGKSRAMELILTGDIISADEAHKIGLVNAVYSSDELMPNVEAFVNKILAKAPIAISAAVECINAQDELSLDAGLAFESFKFGNVCGTDDFKEGTMAFLEKRKADFKGK